VFLAFNQFKCVYSVTMVELEMRVKVKRKRSTTTASWRQGGGMRHSNPKGHQVGTKIVSHVRLNHRSLKTIGNIRLRPFLSPGARSTRTSRRRSIRIIQRTCASRDVSKHGGSILSCIIHDPLSSLCPWPQLTVFRQTDRYSKWCALRVLSTSSSTRRSRIRARDKCHFSHLRR
jgi:hypothetical protein